LFSETLDGLTTIRAFKAERRLIGRNNQLLDNNVQSYFLNFSANCWLAVRLEFAGTLIVTFAALFAVLARSSNTSDDHTNGPVESEQHREIFAGQSLFLFLSCNDSIVFVSFFENIFVVFYFIFLMM
jgi:ABC-type multidrug transport system fused ATPase/permease subunit